MKLSVLVCWFVLAKTSLAFGQDSRDDDIFGDSSKAGEKDAKTEKAEKIAESQAKALVDTLQIGGRLELRSTASGQEQQRFQEGAFAPSKTADIYFDTRPSEELRVFLRTRISETPNYDVAVPGASRSSTKITQSIDELWFKWDIARTVFMTYGKQHLKWGSGRLWNPTDYTARQSKDPFDLFDRRLGQELLKIHIPNEKMGFNYYAVLQFDDAKRNDDLGLALRAEFAFLGSGELAVTAQTRRGEAQRLGLDVSSALGPIDVHFEASASKRESRSFYRDGVLEDELVVLPSAYKDPDKTFKQAVGGVQYTFKYNADDNISFGAEYFYNELGYDQRIEELFSLILAQSSSLYAGRLYAGAYIQLPNPGSWNKTSFFLTGLSNLSDETGSARLTGTWLVANYATFEAFVSQCVGDYGELCFKIPERLQQVGQVPGADPVLQQILNSLPTRKTVTTAGVGLSINF